MSRIVDTLGIGNTAMGMKKYAASPTAALALGLFFTTTIPIAVDAIINTVASLVSPAIDNLSFMSPAMGQPDALTRKQSDAQFLMRRGSSIANLERFRKFDEMKAQ
jgi:hypothetical protein